MSEAGNQRPMFTSAEGAEKALSAYDTALKEWTVPYKELDVPTSFGSTHVIASGREDRPALVLLHAFFATAAVWYPNAGPLSEHFRVYAVDIMGESNKSRPKKRMTTPDDYTRWFGELLDGLGVHSASLVGNSYGGFVAAQVAMTLPHRVRCLVLIGPAATFHGIVPFYLNLFIPKALYLFFPWLPAQQRVMRHGVRWAHADLPADGLWSHLFYLMLMHGTTTTQVFPKVWSGEELSRIQAPTLLLVGDHEKIYRPDAVIRAARERMPAIKAAVVTDAHHITALAQPRIVNEHIIYFCGTGS